jgi:hypothetical protein
MVRYLRGKSGAGGKNQVNLSFPLPGHPCIGMPAEMIKYNLLKKLQEMKNFTSQTYVSRSTLSEPSANTTDTIT